MAYSRFSRRRTFRRRRPMNYGRRRYRSSYSRRPRQRRFRRRRMTSRRVRNIAARKKQDTIFGASAGSSNAPGYAELVPGNNYFFHNATFRVYQDFDNDHVRNSSEPYMVGVKDRVTLTCTFPYTHRRVCFWTHEQLAVGQPFRFSSDVDDEPMYMRRNLTRFTPEANEDLFEYLFKGTLGVDYSEDTRPITPLDNKRLRVVSDVTYNVNPMVATADASAALGGRIVNRRFWHPLRQTVYYDEDQDGASISPTTPGYVSRSPNSPGNYYIMDIFSTGQAVSDPSGSIGNFKPETTTYWHEA